MKKAKSAKMPVVLLCVTQNEISSFLVSLYLALAQNCTLFTDLNTSPGPVFRIRELFSDQDTRSVKVKL